jgi:hypothetical protein
MFKRSFMQAFKVRKYGIPSAPMGSVSSSVHLLGKKEVFPARVATFLFVSYLMISATENF